MNPANINDPTAVKALLDRLKVSQVWQDAVNSSSLHIAPEHAELHESPAASAFECVQRELNTQSPDAAPPASVASLLSQLRTPAWSSVATNTSLLSNTRTTRQSSDSIPRPSQDPPSNQSEFRAPGPVASTPVQDIRFLSFQQALPHLTQLASDPQFLAAVSRLRLEQNELEQQLWDERQIIRQKHEERVKVARTKAAMIGAGLSKHEADMINDAYRRDLQKFDKERALLAWDALVQKQQAALETLGVPTMFATVSQADSQKQRRVVQVLEGL